MIFTTQPDPRRSPGSLWASLALHAVGAACLVLFGGRILSAPPRRTHVVLFVPAAAPEIPGPMATRTPPPRPPKPLILPRPAPAMQARAPIVFDAPAIPAPAPDRSPQMPLPQLPPAPEPRTERPVVTGVFEERRIGEQAAAPRVMQASGFEVAPTPVAGAKANAAPPVPRSAGFGDTASGASSGSRVRQVASAGFGAASGGQAAMAQARVIRSTGFEDAVVAAAAHRPPESRPSTPASTGVEIIHKPRPAYTEEARRRQIEGEVLVEALFTAAGEVRVLRIVRGLGHGLDESALAAAGGIRFRPATRNGTPEDATATVRITFQLAY